MQTRNRIELTGYCGNNPELTRTAAGVPLCRISLATHEQARTNGEYTQITQWHSVVFWRQLAEKAYAALKRGTALSVTGAVKYRTWIDTQGIEQNSTEIWAATFAVISGNEHQQETERISAGTAILCPLAPNAVIG